MRRVDAVKVLRGNIHLYLRCLGLIIIVLGLMTPVASAERNISILYPEVREPYLSVFHSIIDGAKSNSSVNVKSLGLKKGFDPAEVKQWLSSNQTDAVITLGRRAYSAIKKANIQKPIVVGALRIAPNGVAGISQSADPELLFQNLKNLAPQVSRVIVVYNQLTNNWLVELAKIAAQNSGIKLEALPAKDLREAALHYRELLGRLNGESNAIWLLSDKVATDDKVILPMVLEAAWDKHLVVFSSNPAHAKRGALFSLYPDNFALGQRLVKMAEETHVTSQKKRVEPLKDLQVAVNLRTAAHLGLNYSKRQQKEFHLIFPSQ